MHTASLLALLIYFSGDLLDLARGVMGTGPGFASAWAGLLLVASVPAALAGLFFADFFEAQYDDASVQRCSCC